MLNTFLNKKLYLFILTFFTSFIIIILIVFNHYFYEAETFIMVEEKNGFTTVEKKPIDGYNMMSLMRININLITSNTVIKNLVKDLQLDKEEETNIVMNKLKNNFITVTSPVFTNIISIKVKYKDAATAAAIANSLVDNYIKLKLQFNYDDANNIIKHLEKEIAKEKYKLIKLENYLVDFKNNNNIYNLEKETSNYIDNKSKFESKYSYEKIREKEAYNFINLKSLKMAREIYNQDKFNDNLNNLIIITPQLEENLFVSDIRKKILDLELEKNQLEELYTEESPQVSSAKQRLLYTKTKLKNIILTDMHTQQNIASKMINEYDKKLKSISGIEIILKRLERSIKLHEDNYIFLLKEKRKAELVKNKITTEDIKIISRADIPTKPKGRLKNIASAFVISMFLSIVLCFLFSIKNKLIFF